MYPNRRRFQPTLEALEDRLTPSSRPISDFLMAQGTTSAFPNGPNPGGPVGLPYEVGWGTATATFASGTARFARFDYTGQDAAFLHLNLGTTTSGTISERVLADGTAEDTVNLHTHNAFAWAVNLGDGTNPNPPVIFGYLPSQLAVAQPPTPPVGDSDLQVVLRIPAPGAPLPDIVLVNLGGLPPGYALVSESFHATAMGTTPAGQQATLVVSQTGVLGRTPNLIRDFGFTAEVVDVQIHGPGSTVAPTTFSSMPPTTGGTVPSGGPAASGSVGSGSLEAGTETAAPEMPLSGVPGSDLDSLDAAFATVPDGTLGWWNFGL
jgi:hypothetical protein